MFSSKIRHSAHVAALAIVSLFPAIVGAQTCTEPTGSSFRVVTLVPPATSGSTAATGLADGSGAYGPVQMGIAKDGRVFVAKMQTGQVVVYKPSTPNVTSAVGQIATYANTEDGVLGMALDNNFMTNKWIYVFYSDPCGLNCTNRAMELARFTLDTTVAGTTTGLGQLTKKKIILRFPREKNDNHHAAGGLAFDANGVLVIGTGDNTDPHNSNNAGFGPIYTPTVNADAQRTSANTNDLRGKLLRIKPLAIADGDTTKGGMTTNGIDVTYSIPVGNLWEKINDPAFNPGWNSSTDSMAKVRHEIYTLGHRNPYHPRVDTRTGWIFWGEVGPDANADNTTRGPAGHDEWNLAKSPGFFGHPYCNGYNVPYNTYTGGTSYGGKYDCAATVNNSPNNTGIHHMPPAIPAVVAYTSCNGTCSNDDDPRFNSTYSLTTPTRNQAETSIGGPMYRYDTALASTVKWPPYYEGKIFFFDWERRNFRTINLDSNGILPTGATGVHVFPNSGTLSGLVTASYIDAQFGPEGALYLLKFSGANYGDYTPALYRVEYTGTYDNACYKTFGPANVTAIQPVKSALHRAVAPVFGNGFIQMPVGYRTVELYDIIGRQVWSFHRQQADFEYQARLPAELSKGMLQAKLLP